MPSTFCHPYLRASALAVIVTIAPVNKTKRQYFNREAESENAVARNPMDNGVKESLETGLAVVQN